MSGPLWTVPAQLGQTEDPAALIPGEPFVVRQTAQGLSRFAARLMTAGEGLRGVEADGWSGEAADRFRETFRPEPDRWTSAGRAFLSSTEALDDYAGTLVWAQGQAAEAIEMWRAAEAATKQAKAEHRALLEQAHRASAFSGGAWPVVTVPFDDPGDERRQAARDVLQRAREQLDEAGNRSATVVAAAADQAPPKPRLWERAWAAATEYRRGVYESFAELGKTAWSLSQFRLLIDPAGYAQTVSTIAQSAVYGVQHPVEFAKAVVDWETWQENPWRALGRLAPDAALTIATGGSGAAVRGTRGIDAITDLATRRQRPAPPDADPRALDPPTQVLPRTGGPPGPPRVPDFGPRGADPAPPGSMPAPVPEPPRPPRLTPDDPMWERDDPFELPQLDEPGPRRYEPPSSPTHSEPTTTPDHQPSPGADGPGATDGPNPASSTVGRDPASEYSDQPDFRTEFADHEAYRDRYGEPTPHQERMLAEWRAEHPQLAHLRTEELLALDRFRGAEDAINRALLDGDTDALHELDPLIRETVSGLNRLPSYHGTVFYDATVSRLDLGEFLDSYRTGDWITEVPFVKSDMTPPTDGNVHFVIESQNGKYLPRLDDSIFGSHQVIFPPGTEFRVHNVQVNSETFEVVITLSDVPR